MPILDDPKKAILETMVNYVGLKAYLQIRWRELWQEPLVFQSDHEFWQRLFAEDYGEFLFVNKGRPIYLQNFKLTTWLPFIPGLYYKRLEIDNFRPNPQILRQRNGYIILDMNSKTEFVLNGFANIRFDRITIDNESYLMLNAYTSKNSCLGIPVLVRDRDLNLQNLKDMETKLRFEIQGTLDYFTSDDPKFQYSPFSNKIPVIKAVHRFAIIETGEHGELGEASAWSLIDVWDSKFNKPCCTFANFQIGDKNSLRHANSFIKDYVRKEYNTSKYSVVTDYDEVNPSLSAEYGIRDIGNNELLIHKFRDIRKRYNL